MRIIMLFALAILAGCTTNGFVWHEVTYRRPMPLVGTLSLTIVNNTAYPLSVHVKSQGPLPTSGDTGISPHTTHTFTLSGRSGTRVDLVAHASTDGWLFGQRLVGYALMRTRIPHHTATEEWVVRQSDLGFAYFPEQKRYFVRDH